MKQIELPHLSLVQNTLSSTRHIHIPYWFNGSDIHVSFAKERCVDDYGNVYYKQDDTKIDISFSASFENFLNNHKDVLDDLMPAIDEIRNKFYFAVSSNYTLECIKREIENLFVYE